MAMTAKCDGCGAEEPAFSNGHSWFKPSHWFERTPKGEGRPLTACSRACIEKVEARRQEAGQQSTTVVLPI